MGEIAGGILATAVFDCVADEGDILFKIYIEGWDSPVGFGVLWFLLHVEDAAVGIEFDDACALEFLDGWLVVAHDAGGGFLAGEVDEVAEGEEQEVIGCDNEEIIVNGELVEGEEEIADSTEAGFVGGGAIVDDGDGFRVVLFGSPLVEDGGELVVGNDDVLGDVGDGVDVIEHASEDGVVANLQEGLGEVSGEFAQARGIACGYNDCLHVVV